jgi:hypothetical protein
MASPFGAGGGSFLLPLSDVGASWEATPLSVALGGGSGNTTGGGGGGGAPGGASFPGAPAP